MGRGPKPANYFGMHRGKGDASVGEVAEFLVGGEGTAAWPRQLHIAQSSDSDTDWAIADQTDPMVFVHSATTPASNYFRMWHNGTTAFLSSTGGTLDLAGVGSVTINEDSNDVDFRVEGANNANMILVDAAQDALSFGGANVDGAAMTFNNTTARTAVLSVGLQHHMPAQTTLVDNPGCVTLAQGASTWYELQTYNNTAGTQTTVTDMATMWIAGAPIGTACNVILTKAAALMVETGNISLGVVGGTGGSLLFAGTTDSTWGINGGASPSDITYVWPQADASCTGDQLSTTTGGVMSWTADTSVRESKELHGIICGDKAYDNITRVPVYEFEYTDDFKNGTNNCGKNPRHATAQYGHSAHPFTGVVADEAPWAMQGEYNRVFSPINAFGQLTAAFQVLANKVETLQGAE